MVLAVFEPWDGREADDFSTLAPVEFPYARPFLSMDTSSMCFRFFDDIVFLSSAFRLAAFVIRTMYGASGSVLMWARLDGISLSTKPAPTSPVYPYSSAANLA